MAKTSLVLVINCGSSSLKFALIDSDTGEQPVQGLAEKLAMPGAQLSWKTGGKKNSLDLEGAGHEAAIKAVIDILERSGNLDSGLAAVGHRVVHGGEFFQSATLLDDAAIEKIARCNHLAPLHNPANLLGIDICRQIFPGIPQVAVFDTAFHQTLPKPAYLYGVPYDYYKRFGVRRYGFHGTSHQYITLKAAEVLGKSPEECCLLIAHLGNGCSATAVRDGLSVDTTMGLTPLEGLIMGTRSGDVDPGLHGFLADELGCDLKEVTRILNQDSGLLGLSGVSNDMREIYASIDQGNEQAQTAVDVFCFRLTRLLGGLAVSLPRVDALVFTGGIGENDANVRKQVMTRMAILGFACDDQRNARHGKDSDHRINADGNTCAMVIPTDEELTIARQSIMVVGDN